MATDVPENRRVPGDIDAVSRAQLMLCSAVPSIE